MIEWTGLFLAIYGILVLIAGIGTARHYLGEFGPSDKSTKTYALEQLSVVIPMRNEVNRIDALVSSINQSVWQPLEWIFVDDFSEDLTMEKVIGQLNIRNYLVIPSTAHGKKAAIETGIDQAQGRFILTMDADVHFAPDFLLALSQLKVHDMHILPVEILTSKRTRLLHLDSHLANAMNVSTSGFGRPILCSGANLLYRKEAFESVHGYASNSETSSGDDAFLLKSFQEHKLQVAVATDIPLRVHTDAPQGWSELLQQRLRWLGKTLRVGDRLSSGIALMQFILTMGFWTLVAVALCYQAWFTILVLFLGKTILDMLLFGPFLIQQKKAYFLLWFPIYQCWFPFYNAILLYGMKFTKPIWKDRPVRV